MVRLAPCVAAAFIFFALCVGFAQSSDLKASEEEVGIIKPLEHSLVVNTSTAPTPTPLPPPACVKGVNCTCGQCAEQGYSQYCTITDKCYNTVFTCSFNCGGGHNCLETAACTPSAECSPAAVAQCGTNGTCCVNSNGNSFCSVYGANAVCCQYGDMSCPSGNVCYPPLLKCLPQSPTPPPTCDQCKQVVQSIENGACDDCALLFPSFSWLCVLIQKLGFCDWIKGKGLPPSDVCAMIGFCGQAGCACGYCRPQLYGQWCLSLPNVCPVSAELEQQPESLLLAGARNHGESGNEDKNKHTDPQDVPPAARLAFRSEKERDAHYEALIGGIVAKERRLREKEVSGRDGHNDATHRLEGYCVDGMCTAATAGCCLTCA